MGNIRQQIKLRLHRQSGAGFTFIELLTVIAIIGILASIGSVMFVKSRQKARDAKRVTDIQHIAEAFTLFLDDNSTTLYTNNKVCPLFIGYGALMCTSDPIYDSSYNWVNGTANGGVYLQKLKEAFAGYGGLPTDPTNNRIGGKYYDFRAYIDEQGLLCCQNINDLTDIDYGCKASHTNSIYVTTRFEGPKPVSKVPNPPCKSNSYVNTNLLAGTGAELYFFAPEPVSIFQ